MKIKYVNIVQRLHAKSVISKILLEGVRYVSLGKNLVSCYNVDMKKQMLSKFFNKRQIQSAVSSSSKIEGIRFSRAIKNSFIIKKLQKYGRAFSV